jgi:hypothetical protein
MPSNSTVQGFKTRGVAKTRYAADTVLRAQYLASTQTPLNNDIARGIDTMKLKDRLCDIQSYLLVP